MFQVVEWILSIAKHVPSDEQCQKCITAPWEEKDNERDLLYLRTMCYEMIKKVCSQLSFCCRLRGP